MGDPSGIGPEVAVRAVEQLAASGEPVEWTLFGCRAVFAAAGLSRSLVSRVRQAEVPVAPTSGTTWQQGSAAAGSAEVAALEAALELAVAGRVDAVCTAPLNKAAMAAAGHDWPGQTEILIQRSGAERGEMLFVGGGLRVALATRHLPLARVPQVLRAADLVATLLLLDRSLEFDFGLERRRIAVAGLNPHAGEEGLFGVEEREILAPALATVRELGLEVSGPLPADTLFVRQQKGEFDASLAMYHDQGLIPVKLLAFGAGVNATIGLPFVRTSPDHGTAYDIAGKGVADASSMFEAIRLAIGMARNRRSLLHRTGEGG